MVMNNGNWNGKPVIRDKTYLKEALTSSQSLNPYYGYLWWLNDPTKGEKKTKRNPNAPRDMVSANGALNRRCFVVPSLQLVVTRLGDRPKGVGKAFDAEFWKLLMAAAPQ